MAYFPPADPTGVALGAYALADRYASDPERQSRCSGLTGEARWSRPTTTMVRKRKASWWGVAILVASFVGLVADALGLPPFTTAPKFSSGGRGQAELVAVATGCHPTFDRFVIRARFATPGYDVRYVRQIVVDPSGLPVRLLGTNRIRVAIRQARGHTQAGTNLLPAVRTPLCSNLRQVRKAGDFEGIVSFGLGLRRKTGFRVFRLTGPTRIVIDVAH